MVKNFNFKLKEDTIIEGELIHLTSQNKYLFMTYDCLFYDGKDVRIESDFSVRLDYTKKVTESLTSSKFKYEEYQPDKKNPYDIKKQRNFYQGKIDQFYKSLNELISQA